LGIVICKENVYLGDIDIYEKDIWNRDIGNCDIYVGKRYWDKRESEG
jgi:hypothetical protein